jgi:hypothetical protein
VWLRQRALWRRCESCAVRAQPQALISRGATRLRYGGGAAQDMYILNAAEAAGIDLPATCRGGICGCAAQAGSAHCAAAHTPLR